MRGIRLCIFLLFSILLFMPLDYISADNLEFKKVFELKKDKKDKVPIISVYAQAKSKDKISEKWADNLVKSYFRDDFGQSYRVYNDQLKNRGVIIGPVDIDASKPGRRIEGLSTEDDSTEMVKRERANLYLKYRDLIGRVESLKISGDVLRNYIEKVKDQQTISNDPKTSGYSVYFIDSLDSVVLDRSHVIQHLLSFKSSLADYEALTIKSKCQKCVVFNKDKASVELDLRAINAFSKSNEDASADISKLMKKYISSAQVFIEGISYKHENSLILMEYPNYLATQSALYISAPNFFNDPKNLDIAEQEVNKKLPIKDKNTKKSKDKNLIELELTIHTVSFLENQYFLWLFSDLYRDSLSADASRIHDFSLFRSTMIEMIDDEFDRRR